MQSESMKTEMPAVYCMKTLRNMELIVDFLSKYQLADREIVSCSATEFQPSLHMRPESVRRLNLCDRLKSNLGSHYEGWVDGVRVSTIDERRYLLEAAGELR